MDVQAQFCAVQSEHEPSVLYINRNIVRELQETYKEIENPALLCRALATDKVCPLLSPNLLY